MTQAALLWRSYSKSRTAGDRERLIERYAPLAKYVVDRLNISLPPSMGYEDLVGQAVIGLMEAIDSFDPGRGVKFETYAYHRIRGSVIDMLREMDWLPRTLRRKERELSSASEALETKLGRAPTEKEIAAELEISPEELVQLNCSLRMQNMQSLNEIVGDADGELVEVLEVVADEDALSPQICTEEQEEKRLLAEAIDALPEKERTVIALYYQEELTLKEIAKVLDVTESWVCQLHSRAVSKLRDKLTPNQGHEREVENAGARR
ncbi:MAG: FliA/WhiG family RNA polymerase sigma factor [Armatimonadetes bacterium]|nr:FliA/WhiG family RNA polymerase sigma factor [Armatimonadota bacterium]NIM24345.1 FliA/WhiG family RNA polymerase sigma factor [Armatimonadota bacterium]NIM68214.1 FliA/WhiG family RNA polymerase sigma factor [Armatimonadota bacterium]NIM75115.1 FliA/WhiG family RNA polymerase sigma factor [Armatimonadota bacterium]NIN06419.1 FliA/WhiG family RNA polymerase sigma factor [Armatimonadota bacterium]